jgi:glutamate racemase
MVRKPSRAIGLRPVVACAVHAAINMHRRRLAAVSAFFGVLAPPYSAAERQRMREQIAILGTQPAPHSSEPAAMPVASSSAAMG